MPRQRKIEEAKLIAYAETLPGWDETEIRLFLEDERFLQRSIQSELEDYEKTGDIRYLLLTLRQAAKAKGWKTLYRRLVFLDQRFTTPCRGKVASRWIRWQKFFRFWVSGYISNV